MILSPFQRQTIIQKIDEMFDSLKARLQGRFFRGPAIYFEVIKDATPQDTIEGMYIHALKSLFGPDARPISERNLEHISEITGNYIDAQKLKMKNHIIADVLNAKNANEATQTIASNFKNAQGYISMLVANESKLVQSYASREGISRIAADVKDEDPTIIWLGIVDNKLCKHCKKMYHSQANLSKPRPWKMSQLRDGYFKPKEWDNASVYHNAHPNCRHTMSYVPKNMGFNDSGQIEFKHFGYDYYQDYHSTHKAEIEFGESLQKGLMGDWQKEGYKLEHTHNPDLNQHRISAVSPTGQIAGSFIFEQGPQGFMATSAHVKPEHQRKGLATAAYQLFENRTGKSLVPHTGRGGESKQSPDAEALWSSPNRPFGKSEDLDLDLSDFFTDYDEYIAYQIEHEKEHQKSSKP